MKNIYMIMIGVLALLVSCESIEDTYDQFSEAGMIRYVGKCSDLQVFPGWERVELKWANSIDPTIANIRVSWMGEDEIVRDTLLAKDATECNITNLADEVYTFRVAAVDAMGNASIEEEDYGRPYTYSHESVIGFSKVVVKNYKVKDNLILFFDRWQPTLMEVTLNYYQSDEEKSLPLTEEEVGLGYMVLEHIDVEKPVSILRTGSLEECPDVIVFQPDTLNLDAHAFANDFSTSLRNRYQVDDIDNDAFLSRTVLEFDDDLTSLEDILYFPNLEKVILGGNRYMDASYIAEMGNSQMAKLEEIEESLRVLDWANKYLGVTVEHYNQHYFTTEETAGRSYFNAMGNPELPVLNYLDTEGWTITATGEEETGYDPGLKNLLDNNSETIWKPLPSSTLVREHEFVIDMKEEKTFNGFKITQKAFLSSGDGDLPYLPSFVKIQTSTNNVSWDIPLIAEENSIGNTPGESTILRMNNPITARYVRVTVNDVVYFITFNTLLADFMLFTD